jgi:hypothetical protein
VQAVGEAWDLVDVRQLGEALGRGLGRQLHDDAMLLLQLLLALREQVSQHLDAAPRGGLGAWGAVVHRTHIQEEV